MDLIPTVCEEKKKTFIINLKSLQIIWDKCSSAAELLFFAHQSYSKCLALHKDWKQGAAQLFSIINHIRASQDYLFGRFMEIST